jgi:hypothetical protein
VSAAKECGCGRTHTPSEWPHLPFVGVMDGFEAEGNEPAIPSLELRNCDCGSTLAVEIQ